MSFDSDGNPYRSTNQEELFGADTPYRSPFRFLRLLIPYFAAAVLAFMGSWVSVWLPLVIVGFLAAAAAGAIPGGMTGTILNYIGIRGKGAALFFGVLVGLFSAYIFLGTDFWVSVNNEARKKLNEKIVQEDGSVKTVRELLAQGKDDVPEANPNVPPAEDSAGEKQSLVDPDDKATDLPNHFVIEQKDGAKPFGGQSPKERFRINMFLRIMFGKGLTLREAFLKPDWLYQYFLLVLHEEQKGAIYLALELIVIVCCAAGTAKESIGKSNGNVKPIEQETT